MAILNGDNVAKGLTVDKIGQGEQGGKLKCIKETYTLQGAVLAVSDVIELGEIPAGAIVHEVVAEGASLGTTGIIDLGWAASEAGGEAADANGFIPAFDLGGAAAIGKMTAAANNAGFLKEFSEPVKVQAVCTEISTATDTAMKFAVYYTLD